MTKNIKLYVARREKGYYQKDVAKKIGLHPQTYHEKEAGKKEFTIREAKMLCKVFSCTLNDLFQEEVN
ncbi:transcriptional regulator [Oceanobacillus arenosus]|uniref:Transcriptional regulator n=1 Tax=Oceanobacillus arenosus TaxID=1229153 RepID=A0A3D8PNB4_9BACI|nr:helix-turn-helix domain-containing protein [Oceanobacillus arenosus]RDW17600.1 transcriptional regulator [Oceanobacillus arenosus]